MLRSPALTIRLFPLFAALSFTPVMVPSLVPFWHDNGLDTFHIYLLQAVFSGAVVLLEVPTGMVADRLGKRTSLLAGQIAVAVGAFLYALSASFGGFLAAEITLALGMALLSGADSAIVYDCLKSLGREREFPTIEGRSQSIRLLVFALCNIIGGVLAEHSLRAPMWASVIGPVVAIPVVLAFADGLAPPVTTSFRESLREYRSLTTASVQFLSKHRLVRWIVSFQAVLVASAAWLLWSYQPYLELTGLPVWAVGAMFATYQIGAAICSRYAPSIAKRLGERGTFAFLAILQTLTPLAMAVAGGPAAGLLVLGHQAVRGIFRPVLTARVLEYTFADKRATVLSFASLAGRLGFAVTGPIMGWVGGAFSLRQALGVQGATLLLAFVFLAVEYRSIPAKYRTAKVAGTGAHL